MLTKSRLDNVDRIEEDHVENPVIGRWFWLPTKEWDREKQEHVPGPKIIVCVSHVGSNFVEVRHLVAGYHTSKSRISTEEFITTAERELDPESVFAGKVAEKQALVASTMEEIQKVTLQLQVGSPGTINETKALARVDGPRIESYKEALVVAKTKTLPELFATVKKETEALSMWMGASILGMQVNMLEEKTLVKAVEKRIFNIDLYAGFSEDFVKIQDGAPAAIDEKIHLFQRRHYMDEECLADWEEGGLDFTQIEGFDRWLLKPENLKRILPFDRSVVAFRVRRYDREADTHNAGEMIGLIRENEKNRRTYLYMRNGEQVFRLITTIDFGEALFPDMAEVLSAERGVRYVNTYSSERELITEAQYLGLLEDEKATWERNEARRLAVEAKTGKPEEAWRYHGIHPSWNSVARNWRVFDETYLYFDDVNAANAEKVEEHNRLVLLLQGLLDRTEAFAPHPKWELWGEGFSAGLKLIYDKDYTLHSGPEPDIEAYIAETNKGMKKGSLVVGVQDVWLRHEAVKLNQHHRDRGLRYADMLRYKPPGNVGPQNLPSGKAARVHAMRGGKAYFQWYRESNRNFDNMVKASFSCSTQKILCIDNYKLGDYKQFFTDPRIRAKYMQWAHLLIAAEEAVVARDKGLFDIEFEDEEEGDE